MGKPTGFIDYDREVPSDIDPMERIANWDEFHIQMSEDALQKQGARCMDCGIPFCHTGRLLGGMASGCPINNLIPEWNDLVYQGLWPEAVERLHKTNNFPEFTGRVCPAPCEGACTLGIHTPPVTIKNIECAIADRGWEDGWIEPAPPSVRTGKNVAVVGSGPAGLAAAAQLNKAGHSVTVFERADRPGGLLMYGIPNMKLDKKEVVLRRIRLMEEEGVKFACGTEIGKDMPAEKLLADFDAVLMATGATVPRDLPIDGRDSDGVHFAMEFLASNTKALLDGAEPPISADGKDVVVIGGGDTGTDCVGTSLRHGCRSVVQIEIMPRPPAERQPDNPWPEWPKILRTDYGQQEAAAKFGDDPRVFLRTATKFETDAEGRISAVHTIEVEWQRDENGRYTPVQKPGTEKIHPAQLVLLAMGFLGPEQELVEALGLKCDPRSNILAAPGDHRTSAGKVFAAGDCRRGQSLVVWAIDEGRKAAREIDRYLMGETALP
jgi:glutamate synthase (NADPH/NADH) small chain